jgi:RNA polymerase sigma-70 factor (ECF subfamily)
MHLNEPNRDVASKGLRASIFEVLPVLEARALRLTRSRPDAEDLVQETVLRALRFEGTFQRGTNLRAWMQQILQSVFISRCRRRARERRAFDRFAFDPTLTTRATAAPVLSSVSGKMHAAFSLLPERFRRVVELVDLCDYTYREAAEVLEVPVGTVMSRLFRARRMLEEALGEERETAAVKKSAAGAVAKTVPAPHRLVPAANEATSSPSEPARAA